MPFMSSRPSGEANAAGPGQIFSHPHSKPFRPVPCLFTVSRSFIACLRTVSWLAAQCPRPTTRQIPTFPFLLSAPSFFVSSLTLPSHVVAMALKATAVAAILAMTAARAAAQTCRIVHGGFSFPPSPFVFSPSRFARTHAQRCGYPARTRFHLPLRTGLLFLFLGRVALLSFLSLPLPLFFSPASPLLNLPFFRA